MSYSHEWIFSSWIFITWELHILSIQYIIQHFNIQHINQYLIVLMIWFHWAKGILEWNKPNSQCHHSKISVTAPDICKIFQLSLDIHSVEHQICFISISKIQDKYFYSILLPFSIFITKIIFYHFLRWRIFQ